MRFVNSVLFAASALASFVAAQSATLQFTKVPTAVTAGESYSIEWKTEDNTTPVTIKLRVGKSTDLQDVTVLTSTGAGGKYTWTPSKGLGDASNYALEIIQGTEVNYSGAIALSGGSASSLPASAQSTASASASASSASASASSASAKSASSQSGSTLTTATIASRTPSGSASSASKAGSTSSGSLTAATTRTTDSAATSTNDAQGAPTSTGAAATLGSSPMALIFGAAAMMAYLN